MRKVDYEILAAAISDEIRSADTWLNATGEDESAKTIASARKSCATRIARNFADRASVKRDEFLTACGIK